MKSSLIRKVVIGTFLSVPAISSIISTIHLIDLFNLGNPTWLSIFLAVTFELGSIASLLAISVIERIKTGAIWFIFFILSGLQIVGNVYYSYSFTSDQLLSNPTFLTNFMDLFSFITGEEIRDVKIFLSCIIGIPIPLIALFFLKSNIDYLRPNNNDRSNRIETEGKPDQEAVIDIPSESERDTEKEPESESSTEQSIEIPQPDPHPMDDDPSMDDHVVINIPIDQEDQEIEEPKDVTEDGTQGTDIQDVQQEVKIEQAKEPSTRSPKPMISQRRRDAMSVLHRG